MTVKVVVPLGLEWKIDLPADRVSKLREIAIDAQRYRVELIAKEHVASTWDGDESVERGVVALRALPVVEGTASLKGQPPVGMLIEQPDGSILGRADADGRFSISIPSEWPDYLVLRDIGGALSIVPLPSTPGDVALGLVELGETGSFRLAIPEALLSEDAIGFELIHHVDENTRHKILERTISPGKEPAVLVPNLPPGRYELTLSGVQPLQKIGAKAHLPAKQIVDIQPKAQRTIVTINVRRGGSALGGSRVEVIQRETGWRTQLTANDEGSVVEETWQGGDWLLAVTGGPLTSPYIDSHVVPDVSEHEWTVSVPERVITGAVIDKDDQPVTGARVELRTHLPEDVVNVTTVATDADGRFRFTGVAAGTQSLQASSPRHGRSNAVRVQMVEHEMERHVLLAFRPSIERELIVIDLRGVPLVGAFVMDAVGNTRRTDAEGRVAVSASKAAVAEVFVVPREGSFAVISVDFSKGPNSLSVRIPDATASLNVRTQRRSGDPIEGTFFLVRFNGRVLPIPVLALFGQAQGVSLRSGADGIMRWPRVPSGLYELWPHWSAEQGRALDPASGKSAPVTINVTAGVTSATLTFDPTP